MASVSAAAAAHAGALLFVADEPGSRLADRLARAAAGQGVEVLRLTSSSALLRTAEGDHERLAALLHEQADGRPLLVVIDDPELVRRMDATGYGDPGSRCRLLLLVADVRMASAEIAAARDACQRAAALARTANAPGLLARAALGVGVASTLGVVDHLEIRLLEEALDAVGEADGVMRARLVARLAVALVGTASLTRRRELSDDAVAAARGAGDPAALGAVLVDRHVAIAMNDGAEERLALSSEAVRTLWATDDRRLELRARSLRLGSLLELGDMDRLRTELEVCESMTEELGLGDRSWHLPMVRAGLAALAGRLDDAERLADQGLRQGTRAQHPGLDVYHTGLLALIRYLQGRLPELEDGLRRRVDRYPTAPQWRCTLVLALHDAGRHEEARRQFEVIAAEDFAMVTPHLPLAHTLALLALACDAAGDARRAAILHPLLEAHGDHLVQMGQTATGCLGAAAHYTGLLCCAMSRWDEAVAHFRAAIETNARAGAVAFVANSRYQLGRALRALGEPAAGEQLDRAAETARALGMRVWRGGDRAAGAVPGPLSRREWEVARLVAAGIGNAEIAARLHISKRTVESHVEHVRTKLDLASRAAIVSWVVRHT